MFMTLLEATLGLRCVLVLFAFWPPEREKDMRQINPLSVSRAKTRRTKASALQLRQPFDTHDLCLTISGHSGATADSGGIPGF